MTHTIPDEPAAFAKDIQEGRVMIETSDTARLATARATPLTVDTGSFQEEILSLVAGKETLIFENAVPPFVADELERLYRIASSARLHFELCGHLEDASTYVVRRNGKPVTLLLFRRHGREIVVLNEVIRLNYEELLHFVLAIFARFGDASVVTFTAIQADTVGFPLPLQRFHFTEDFVLPLPASEEAYLSSLGRNMRSTVKRFSNRVARDFPTYRHAIYERSEADEALLREILRLHHARMEGKNIVSSIDEAEFTQIVALTRAYGMVHVATIGGRVCAGLICWRVGKSCEMRIIAHDPSYNEYKLGTLSCYHTICASIERGDSEFRFGWGRADYKYRFLGVGQQYDRIRIYRSWLHVAYCARLALDTAISGIESEARFWLQNAKQRDDFMPRMAARLVSLLKGRK